MCGALSGYLGVKQLIRQKIYEIRGHGQKGHEELLLILGILGAKLSDATSLLIPGIKGKMDDQGEFKDEETGKLFRRLVDSFKVFSEEGGRG